ncbi:hypothetical protein HN371_17320 [Candidatus Poribacteria bacterium]|nr:hypothetical protein [Candidatus Poribacteria bacterium]MBT5533115.1 hypothetical protein [Candidatus Poribacteria bacterium]MBT5713150.1 hypothetical protein [Candidatus Poribacteria bacterium]MBT7097913.1 hypothetical protein [Candidatus Poribacteria bacterium]MBT7805560.1 hypothetical protein [Candidatus Poribacteria bacterium]
MKIGRPQPATLTWGWRDIVASARWGFSDRKIALHARGVAISYLLTLTYLYLLPAGDSAAPFRDRFADTGFDLVGLLGATLAAALERGNGRGGPAAALYLAPLLIAVVWAVNAYYGIAVARMTCMQVRGDFFAEIRDGLACARRRLRGVLTVMLVLAAVPMVVAAAMVAAGSLTRIPAIGAIWLAVGPVMILPAFFLSLLVALVTLILAAGALSLPAIAGVSDDRAVETSYQLTVIVWGQGWRLVAYHAVTLAVAAVSGAVFAAVGARALFWTVGAVCAGAPRYTAIVSAAAHSLWGASRWAAWLTGWQLTPVSGLSALEQASAWVTGVGFFGVTVVFVAYVVSVVSVGSAMGYMNLLRRIWGVNVLVASEDETVTDTDAAPPATRPAPTTPPGDG